LTTVTGTADYIPSESLEANPVYSISDDVFSFAGISLFMNSQHHLALKDQIQSQIGCLYKIPF